MAACRDSALVSGLNLRHSIASASSASLSWLQRDTAHDTGVVSALHVCGPMHSDPGGVRWRVPHSVKHREACKGWCEGGLSPSALHAEQEVVKGPFPEEKVEMLLDRDRVWHRETRRVSCVTLHDIHLCAASIHARQTTPRSMRLLGILGRQLQNVTSGCPSEARGEAPEHF